jgi:hypothetical protein
MPEETDYPGGSRADQFVAYQREQAKVAGEATDDEETAPTEQSSDDDAATPQTDEEETIVQDGTEDTDAPADTDASTQDEDTEGETQAAPSTDEAEVDAEAADLDDETIAEIAKVYRDKLLSTKEIQSQVKEIIEAQVQQEQTRLQRQAQEQSAVSELLGRGKVALEGLTEMLDSAVSEIEKAQEDEDYTPTHDALDPKQFEQYVSDYGMSMVAEVSGRYNRALDAGILDALSELPQLSDEHQQGLQAIIATAQRMEGDPNQARNAVPYATSSFIKFLTSRAREAGAADERERVTTSASVSKKVANSVVAKAAAAKLAASRGKVPPNSGANAKPEAGSGGISEADYDRAIAKGDFDEADRIVNAMSKRVAAGGRV